MLVKVKLYGGLVCNNANLDTSKSKFDLEMADGSVIQDLQMALKLDTRRLVNMVNGKAQSADYVLTDGSEVSFFPSMGERKHDFFKTLKS